MSWETMALRIDIVEMFPSGHRDVCLPSATSARRITARRAELTGRIGLLLR